MGIEFRSDLARKVNFENAGNEVRKNGHFIPDASLHEKLHQMREKSSKPKKKKPWFLIITIITTVPMFFMDGMIPTDAISMIKQLPAQIQQAGSKASSNVNGTINSSNPLDVTKISITVGGKTFTKEMSVGDIQALQGSM